MNLKSLFAQFVKERRYMDNVTDKTVIWYEQSWRAFNRSVGTPDHLERQVLGEFVINRGVDINHAALKREIDESLRRIGLFLSGNRTRDAQSLVLL